MTAVRKFWKILFLVSIPLFAASPPVGATDTEQAAEKTKSKPPQGDIAIDLKNMVVMVNGTTAVGKPVQGAGLVVGADPSGKTYIVTARHVVYDEFSGAFDFSVRFHGAPEASLPGELVKFDFNKFLDLALISVERAEALPLPSDLASLPVGRLAEPMEPGEEVTLIGQTEGVPWAQTPVPEQVGMRTGDRVLIISQSGGPGLSGGIAIDGNQRIFGIALSDDRSVITVLPLSVIADELKRFDYPFIIQEAPTTPDTIDLTKAIALVDRAKDVRDGSDQGQSEALGVLVAQGYEFTSTDFAGISFAGAQLKSINLQEARLWLTVFDNANLSDANLARAGLRFARARDADFSNADLSGSYAPFLDATGASFADSNLSSANFYGADLRNADFSGANLNGAAFTFADLRGANLSGASLVGAHFVGAILEGAELEGARFEETNMLGARLNPFMLGAEQRDGTCHFSLIGGQDHREVEIFERWESNRYDSGYEYDELGEYDSWFAVYGLSASLLPLCADRKATAPVFDPDYPASLRIMIDRKYLDIASRRSFVLTKRGQFFKRVGASSTEGVMYSHIPG